jgi:hypothetical protein
MCVYCAVTIQLLETLVFGVMGAACFDSEIRAALGGK